MKMEYPSVVLRVAAGLLLTIVVGWPQLSRAGSGVAAVTSKVADAKALAQVVEAVARESGWTITAPALEGRALIDVDGCLERESPLPCLSPILAEHGADHLVYLAVNASPEDAGVWQLRASVVLPRSDEPALVERTCRACKEEALRAVTRDAVRAAIREAVAASTVLEILVSPPGSWVYVDGEGVPTEPRGDKLLARARTSAGEHVVTVEKAGMPSALRKVRAEEGEVTQVTIELGVTSQVPEGKGPKRTLRGSLAWGLLGLGVVAAASGGVLIALDEDVPAQGQPRDRRYFDSAPFGAGLLVAGAATAVAGAAMLWLLPDGSSAQVKVGPEGAAVSWSKAF